MPEIAAEDLRERITIQRSTATPNGYNEPVLTWSEYAVMWAKALDVSAGEAYRAAQVSAEISTRFTVRYAGAAAAIDPTYRIIWRGRVYEITGVRVLDGRSFAEIDAVARAEAA